MAGSHGPGRRARRRSHTTAAVLISAVVLLAVLAAVAAIMFLHSRSNNLAQGRQVKLPSKVTSTQAIGLANLGQTSQVQASNTPATLLYAGGAGLVFTPSSGGQSVQPSQQWQASQMGSSGQFVLLFSPDGLCLTAAGRGARASAQLDHCDTKIDQRWYHPFLGTDASGRDYWQLRSASTGRCLAVGGADASGVAVAALQRCSPARPPAQLIMFWSAY